VAHQDLVDQRGIDARAFERGARGDRGKRGGMNGPKHAAIPADGRPCGRHDDRAFN
jgi:hypothetical protein